MHRYNLAAAAMLLAIALTAGLLTGAAVLASQTAHAGGAVHGSSRVAQQAPATDAVTPSLANTAAVIVQLDSHHTLVHSLTFTEPITGLEALQRTGIDVTVAESSFGPAVCAIQGAGCPVDNCFCNPDRFWNYAYWDGAAWQSYPVGPSQSTISTTGAIEGWRWGTFTETMAPAPQATAALRALAWLRGQQDARTGGYGDSTAAAVEVMLAVGANGESAGSWRPAPATLTETSALTDVSSLADFIQIRARRFARMGVAEAAKLAMASAATASCEPARTLLPTDYYSPTLGAFAADSGFNAWSILGSLAISQSAPVSAVERLAGQILPSGGWEWQAGFGADTNTTALAVQTLRATGSPVTATAVVSGLAFLKSGQQPSGGIAYDPAQPDFGADANSTAYAIQALLAAGEDPAGAAWTVDDNNPVSYLLSLQLPDGSFEWQKDTGPNLLATTQAVAALLGQPYPIAIRELETCIRPAQ
jgi:hypothetical protein